VPRIVKQDVMGLKRAAVHLHASCRHIVALSYYTAHRIVLCAQDCDLAHRGGGHRRSVRDRQHPRLGGHRPRRLNMILQRRSAQRLWRRTCAWSGAACLVSAAGNTGIQPVARNSVHISMEFGLVSSPTARAEDFGASATSTLPALGGLSCRFAQPPAVAAAWLQ